MWVKDNNNNNNNEKMNLLYSRPDVMQQHGHDVVLEDGNILS